MVYLQLVKTMQHKKWLELAGVVSLALITTQLFWDGELDKQFATLFYYPEALENHWPLQKLTFWLGLYDAGYPSVMISLTVSLALIAYARVNQSYRRFSKRAWYFILVIALGPGLVVNLVLKDHWGRPRPRETVEFQGAYQYQPPTVKSDAGKRSFVCGHCSTGYMFFAFYFMLRSGQSIAFFLALAYSLLMGIARMTAGAHFVSDILWSGYVVFLVCWLLYYVVFKEFRNDGVP